MLAYISATIMGLLFTIIMIGLTAAALCGYLYGSMCLTMVLLTAAAALMLINSSIHDIREGIRRYHTRKE